VEALVLRRSDSSDLARIVHVGRRRALAAVPRAHAAEKPIQGLEQTADAPDATKGWPPVSDRKIRVGLVSEYYHYMDQLIASHKDWCVGLPPPSRCRG